MNFDVYQGRTRRLQAELTTATGAAQNLTGKRLIFVVKDAMESADPGEIVYSLTVDESGTPDAQGIVFGRPVPTNPATMELETVSSGWVTIELDDDDTRGLTPGAHPYELVLIETTRVHQLRAGTMNVIDTLIEDPEAYA